MRTPLDATIIVSVRFTTGNRVVAARSGNAMFADKARSCRSTRNAPESRIVADGFDAASAHAAGCCYSRAAAPFRYIIPRPSNCIRLATFLRKNQTPLPSECREAAVGVCCKSVPRCARAESFGNALPLKSRAVALDKCFWLGYLNLYEK